MDMQGLNTAWLGRYFECHGELSSTNTYAKQNARTLPHGAAIVAERQTAGKGRLGRAWQGGGLALSFLLHGLNVQDLSPLPLVVGLAAVNALKSFAGEGFALKWSNDVLAGEKKLCGILCESVIENSAASVVVGIGVNLSESAGDFKRLGLVYATSLKLATGKNPGKLPVAAAILNEFEPLFEKFKKSGFEPLREEYKQNCLTLGKEVRVIAGDAEQTGTALDIGGDGSLICNINGKIAHIRAGEASVRGLYGYV